MAFQVQVTQVMVSFDLRLMQLGISDCLLKLSFVTSRDGQNIFQKKIQKNSFNWMILIRSGDHCVDGKIYNAFWCCSKFQQVSELVVGKQYDIDNATPLTKISSNELPLFCIRNSERYWTILQNKPLISPTEYTQKFNF